MLWTIAAALQMAAQPAPAVAYLPLGGDGFPHPKSVEGLLGSVAREPGAGLRRADADSASFAPCFAPSRLIDHVEHCIRALLPRGDGQAPLVAVFVEEERRSNVTGSVVLKSLTVRCVGYRGVARAALNNSLAYPHEVERARGPVRQCIAEAARTPAQALVDPATGAATWRFPLSNGGLVRDMALARGNGLERAVIDVEEAGAGGACALSARVTRVLGGWWLRAGDTVRLPVPCGSNGLAHGRPALMFVDFERTLRFLEPL